MQTNHVLEKTCHVCRNKFNAKTATQKYCSSICSNITYGKSSMEYRNSCKVCSKSFLTNDFRILTCSKECNSIYDQDFCLYCSKLFKKVTSNQRWCSDKCKNKIKVLYCKKCNIKFFSKYQQLFVLISAK